MEKQKVIIDMSLWSRGNSSGPWALLNSTGSKCCLGFICEQVFGSKPEDILGRPYYPDTIDVWPSWYSNCVHAAGNFNDSSAYTDTERIRNIKKLFTEAPIELVFLDGDKEIG